MDNSVTSAMLGNGGTTTGEYVTYPQLTGNGTYTGFGGITSNCLWWSPYYYEPTYCTGKAHVFACDHESKCVCGKIQRVMPRAKKAK